MKQEVKHQGWLCLFLNTGLECKQSGLWTCVWGFIGHTRTIGIFIINMLPIRPRKCCFLTGQTSTWQTNSLAKQTFLVSGWLFGLIFPSSSLLKKKKKKKALGKKISQKHFYKLARLLVAHLFRYLFHLTMALEISSNRSGLLGRRDLQSVHLFLKKGLPSWYHRLKSRPSKSHCATST